MKFLLHIALLFFLLTQVNFAYTQSEQRLLNDLSTYIKSNKISEAIETYEKWNRKYAVNYNESDTNIISARYFYATLLYENREDAKAIVEYEAYLNLLEKYNVPLNQHYLIANANLSIIYSKSGVSLASLKLIENCVSYLYKIGNVKSNTYINYLEHLAMGYCEIGYYKTSFLFKDSLNNAVLRKYGKDSKEFNFQKSYPANCNSLTRLGEAYRNDKHEDVISYGYQFLEYYEQNDLLDTLYINVLSKMAYSYSELGDYNSAIRLNKIGLEKCLELYSIKNFNYLNLLLIISSYQSKIGLYEEAILYSKECLKISENLWGKNCNSYALCLNNISIYYKAIGEYSISLQYLIESVKVYKELYGTNNSTYFNSLLNLANSYFNLGDYEKSKELSSECLNIANNFLDKNSLDYGFILYKVGLDYKITGNFTKAIEYLQRTLTILEENIGTNNESYVRVLDNLSAIYNEMQDSKKSIELGKQAIELRKGILLPDKHPQNIETLNNLAVSYLNIGNLIEAKTLLDSCMALIDTSNGKNNVLYASILGNLALYYGEFGNYDTSLSINLSVLKMTEGIFGKDHLKYADCLSNLAVSYSEIGQIAKSKELNEKALNIYGRHFGNEDYRYINTLSNLAVDYSSLGNNKKALEINIKCLKGREILYGKNHQLYLVSLGNIAQSYSNAGLDSLAFQYYQETVELSKILYGKNNLNYILYVTNLADHYRKTDNISKAFKLTEECLAIITSNPTYKENRVYLYNLDRLAFHYLYEGNFNKAYDLSLKAYEVCKVIYGKNHLETAESIRLIGLVKMRNNELNQSDSLFMTSFNILRNSYADNLLYLSEEMKLSYKNRYYVRVIWNLNYFLTKKRHVIRDEVYNQWLNYNGLVSEMDYLTRKCLSFKENESAKELYEKIIVCKKKIAQNIENPQGFDKVYVDSLENAKEMLEAEFYKQISCLQNFKISYGVKDISISLKKYEAFIDFVKVPYSDLTDSVQYLACLVYSDSLNNTKTLYGLLPNGNDMEEINYKYYSSFFLGNNNEHIDTVSFYKYWQKVSTKLQELKINNVYISAGGVYSKINLETLYNPVSDKYVGDEFNIHYVSNGIDFINQKRDTVNENIELTATIFGNPDFSMESKASDTIYSLALNRDLDPFWIDSLNRGNTVSRLPGTKKEVTNIAKKLEDGNWKVSVYTDSIASELNVKSIVSPRVLHIATHGFFFEDIKQESNHFASTYLQNTSQFIQNPLLRSGLLFSGANNALKGVSTKGENGILTAYEASMLDLSNTELVVLSACETGSGEIKNGEGVYGLQRAFRMAGAKSVLMSLWKVDDEATQLLMTSFYEYWLSGKTKHEALKLAKLKLRAIPRFDHPYYWGAFVLMGN